MSPKPHQFRTAEDYRDHLPCEECEPSVKTDFDPVTKPKGYNSHPSGIQPIEICRHLPFALGNAVKYVFRSGIKDPAKTIEDYEKAIWYLNDFLTSRPTFEGMNWFEAANTAIKVQDGRDGNLEGFLRAFFGLTLDTGWNGCVTRSSIEISILFLEGAIAVELDKSR